LVPEGNENSLAQAIRMIKNNPKKKKRLIDNGLKEIKEKYTKIKVAQNLIKMFSKYLNINNAKS